MDDTGDGIAVLGSHDDDVAAVAVADDLILQYFDVSRPRQAVERRPQLSAAGEANRGCRAMRYRVVIDVA
jgi:hypothetical protein